MHKDRTWIIWVYWHESWFPIIQKKNGVDVFSETDLGRIHRDSALGQHQHGEYTLQIRIERWHRKQWIFRVHLEPVRLRPKTFRFTIQFPIGICIVCLFACVFLFEMKWDFGFWFVCMKMLGYRTYSHLCYNIFVSLPVSLLVVLLLPKYCYWKLNRKLHVSRWSNKKYKHLHLLQIICIFSSSPSFSAADISCDRIQNIIACNV